MQPFRYVQAGTPAQAVQAATVQAGSQAGAPTSASAQFLAGGTTLLDLMKLDVMRPQQLIDITGLRRPAGQGIAVTAQGLRIDALASMADVADHPLVLRDYPVIADSLRLAASAQLRNMASIGGNLLQRTRCLYFRDVRWDACNKRKPGSGCAALDGLNRQHAVLGAGSDCIATYPGDLAQALIALDASVETLGPAGPRTLALSALHRAPGSTPHIETALAPGELITAVTVPAGDWTRRSRYVKVRDRASYQFALSSAAIALALDGDRVREVRIALGGVATTPWRAREAEAALRGQRLDEASASAAAERAFAQAVPRQHNAYKLPLGKRTLVRALLETQRMSA